MAAFETGNRHSGKQTGGGSETRATGDGKARVSLIL